MSAKKVSPFSATMIGLHDGVNTNHAAKEIFRNEAKEVTTHLQGIHHARKIGHMQVNYSDTVNKLSKFQQNVPVEMNTQGVSTQMRTSRPLSDQSNMKLSEYNKQMSTYIAVERDINERKREFNREAGRKAEVSTIMAGKGPIPKDVLFPQKATHVQILAMTGKLKAPDANIIPERMPRGKKWLGEGAGWDS